MKRNIIVTLFAFLFLSIAYGQNTYYQFISDNCGGFSATVPTQLELASEQLINILPSNFRDEFRVFSSCFYLHRQSFGNNAREEFQRIIDTAQLKSEYFLLIARELNHAGNITRFWTKLVLPVSDSLNCLTSNDVTLIESKIESKLLNFVGKGKSDFVSAERQSIEYLKDETEYIVHCCHINNNNGNCELNILDNEDILIDLYERGYAGIPIAITNVIGVQSESDSRNANCNIDNYSVVEFNIGNITNCNVRDNICSFIESLPTNITNQIYITDNTTYKDYINIIITDFVNNEYDVAAHFHLYDSNTDYIPDLILYFDYSNIDIAWCPYFEEYDPQGKYYSKFQFAGGNPITISENIEGRDGFWQRIWGDGQNRFIIYSNKYLEDNNIPEENLYYFDISEDISKLVEIGQFILELNFDLIQFQNQIAKFAVIYEPKLQNGNYNELISIFREYPEVWSVLDYYGWDETTGHFNCGDTRQDKWDLYWTSDAVPLPILDKDWAEEFLNCRSTFQQAGNANKFGSRAAKNTPKKAAFKSGNIWKVYSYKVGKLFYYGITKREFDVRLTEHLVKLTKNGEKLIDEKRLYHSIDQQTAKGIEQLFISWHKDLVGNSRNIINSISPHKLLPNNTKAYKEAVNKAYNYLKNTPGIAMPAGYILDDMYDFAKSYYTQATSLPW